MPARAKSNTLVKMENTDGANAPRLVRKTMASLVASAVLVTSAVPVSAAGETYYFRHKTPISWTPGDGSLPDGELPVGNDVTVFFTGAMGQQFSKVIPVNTKDVADWKVDSGTVQPGLELDAATGLISGLPSGKTKNYKAVLLGYDATGTRIARATITFTFHNPVGQPQNLVFYGHTGKYLYREIPASVSVARWDALTEMPDDFKTSGRYLGGTPSKEYNTGVAFVGYDYAGKEVAFASGDLLIQDKPVLDLVEDQLRHPTKNFLLYGAVQHKVGEITYRLKPLDGRSANVVIGPKTGRISGTIPTFNTKLRFQVEAVDVDGTVGESNIFTLSTPAPDVDLASIKDLTGYVGQDYSLTLSGKDLSGDMTWTVLEGRLPNGISLNAETGEISGKPWQAMTMNGIVIGVTTSDGGNAQTSPFTFTIKPEAVEVGFTPTAVRTGRDFTTAGPTFGTGIISPYTFKPSPDITIDPLIDVDYDTAVATGNIETSGNYDVPFSFVNGDGAEMTAVQPITIYDPLAISYGESVTAYRRTPAAIAPTSSIGVIGTPSHELTTGELPEGLAINKATGTISGTPTKIGSAADISVTVTDESGESATSLPFDIEVLDRADVVVSAKSIEVERIVDNNVLAATSANTFDGVSYELVEGTLPEGLSFEDDGFISGSTEDPAATYDGFVVKATDGEGYSAVSEPFSISVVAPKNLAPLAENGTNDAKGQWTAGISFSLPLPRPSNAYGTVSYSLSGLPQGVVVRDDTIEGRIADVGTYPFQMTLTDAAGRTLTGTYTLTIIEPMTAVLDGTGKRLGEDADTSYFDIPRGADAVISPKFTNAILPVTYEFAGTLPDGLAYADGAVTGKAITELQAGTFVLKAIDAVGTKVELPAELKVMQRLPIELSYDIADPAGYVGKDMSPLKPSVSNFIGAYTFKLTGTPPEGVKFDENTGYFYGIPTKDGWSGDLSVTVKDTDAQSPSTDSYGPFRMGISLQGQVGLSTSTNFTVRAGKPFERVIDVTNVSAPMTFGTTTLEDLPYGLTLGKTDGKIAGNLADVGKYPLGTIMVVDSLNRSKQTAVTINALGPLAVAAPSATEFAQYSDFSAAVATTNAVGQTTYELVSGRLPDGVTLNTATGAVAGASAVKGRIDGLKVKVTDSTGESAETGTFSITIGDRLPLTMELAESYEIVANKKTTTTMPVQNAVGGATFVQTGDLPKGISFDAKKGTFSGTPTVIGTFPNITVTVTDSVGASVTKTFQIVTVTNGKPINLTVYDFVTKTNNPIVTQQPIYSNHVGDIRFFADDTLAQKGLTIDPQTGIISGVATEIMEFSPNIHITDMSDRVTSRTVNIKVVPDLSINVAERIDLPVNKRIYPYIYATADNPTGAVTWDIEGTLPTGVSFGRTTHRFTGTPTEIGTFPLKLTVREKAGFGQVATKDITMVVVSTGLAPTVKVTPTASGYIATSGYTITPSYTNAKTGDVLSLAPDSESLPPGVSITRNSYGVYVLTKAKGTADDVGVYEGIKVRVTDVEGKFSDSDPFTIILRTNFYFNTVYQDVRLNAPIEVPPAVMSSGKAAAPLTFRISSNSTGSTDWEIDPDTGALEGTAQKAGSVVVQAREYHGTQLLRSTSYSVVFRSLPLTLTVPDTMGGFTGVKFPDYETKITNPLPDGRFTATGAVPPGLTLDPVSGEFTGTPSKAGIYTVSVVYTDQYSTISKPTTISIDATVADGAGYKYLRIAAENGNPHIWSLFISGTSGYNQMHMIENGAGGYDTGFRPSGHASLMRNTSQAYVLPRPMANGSMTFSTHLSGLIVISGSTDNVNWTTIATKQGNSNTVTYKIPFNYTPPTAEPEPEPTKVDFALTNSADRQTITRYSSVQANITTTARVTATNALYGDLTWTKVSGTIPTGIKAEPNAAGNAMVYSGYPTVSGTYSNIVWRATDQFGNTATSKAVSFTINAGTAMTLSPANGSQSISSGSGTASGTVTTNNRPYGQAATALSWDVTGTLPEGVTWSIVNGAVKFAGKSIQPGSYRMTLKATEPMTNMTATGYYTINVLGAPWWVINNTRNSSNAANVTCPPSTSCTERNRQEVLKVNETEATASSWINWNATNRKLKSVSVMSGYSLPPGVTLRMTDNLSGWEFAGIPTKVGEYLVRIVLVDSTNWTEETYSVNFIVVP